jgi:hypothetical protein
MRNVIGVLKCGSMVVLISGLACYAYAGQYVLAAGDPYVGGNVKIKKPNGTVLSTTPYQLQSGVYGGGGTKNPGIVECTGAITAHLHWVGSDPPPHVVLVEEDCTAHGLGHSGTVDDDLARAQ